MDAAFVITSVFDSPGERTFSSVPVMRSVIYPS